MYFHLWSVNQHLWYSFEYGILVSHQAGTKSYYQLAFLLYIYILSLSMTCGLFDLFLHLTTFVLADHTVCWFFPDIPVFLSPIYALVRFPIKKRKKKDKRIKKNGLSSSLSLPKLTYLSLFLAQILLFYSLAMDRNILSIFETSFFLCALPPTIPTKYLIGYK